MRLAWWTSALAFVPCGSEVSIRVVEAGSRRPVAGAAVAICRARVIVHDDWSSPYVGDEVLRCGWSDELIELGTTDGRGVLRMADRIVEPHIVVAETPKLRGGAIIQELIAVDTFELAIRPRARCRVSVVDPDGRAVAGVPVSFGRFLHGDDPRTSGEDPETWDRLGESPVTDSLGQAVIDGLELTGIEELPILEGRVGSSFGLRPLIYGARCFLPIDVDAPPTEPLVLTIPASTRVAVRTLDADRRPIELDGELEVSASETGAIAPGFPRFVRVERGRCELFPVELGLRGGISVESTLDVDGVLITRRSWPMTLTGIEYNELGESGDTEMPDVMGSTEVPTSVNETSTIELVLPQAWTFFRGRLLELDGTPVTESRIRWTRVVDLEDGRRVETAGRTTTTDTEGRFRFAARRPVDWPGILSIELRPDDVSRGSSYAALAPVDLTAGIGQVDLGEVRIKRASDRGFP